MARPIPTIAYATCLWPGLPEIWWRGRLGALPLAIAFGLALNALLVLRHLLPQWLPASLVSLTFWVGVVAWLVKSSRQMRELRGLLHPREVTEAPDRFAEGQSAYLRGDWKVAEEALTATLRTEPRDPPALLLLIGLYRITDRIDAAEVLLGEMEKLECTAGWELEIEAQRSRIDRDREAAAE